MSDVIFDKILTRQGYKKRPKKLTAEEIESLKQDAAAGFGTRIQLGLKYGVCAATVKNILRPKSSAEIRAMLGESEPKPAEVPTEKPKNFSTAQAAKAAGIHRGTLEQWLGTNSKHPNCPHASTEIPLSGGLILRRWSPEDVAKLKAYTKEHKLENVGRPRKDQKGSRGDAVNLKDHIAAMERQMRESRFPPELIRVTQPRKRQRRSASVDARMLRTKEAARYLGVSEWKLRQMVVTGEIHVVKQKYWLFSIDDLDAWIARNREKEVL